MAAGRLATAGGQFFLLLAAALSLVVITVAVAVTSGDTLGGGVSIGKGGSNGKLDSGGLLRVLRWAGLMEGNSGHLWVLVSSCAVASTTGPVVYGDFYTAIILFYCAPFGRGVYKSRSTKRTTRLSSIRSMKMLLFSGGAP